MFSHVVQNFVNPPTRYFTFECAVLRKSSIATQKKKKKPNTFQNNDCLMASVIYAVQFIHMQKCQIIFSQGDENRTIVLHVNCIIIHILLRYMTSAVLFYAITGEFRQNTRLIYSRKEKKQVAVIKKKKKNENAMMKKKKIIKKGKVIQYATRRITFYRSYVRSITSVQHVWTVYLGGKKKPYHQI